jgi:iron(III) transport system substrate-binding protein
MTAEQETAWKQVEAAANKEGELTHYGTGNIAERAVPVLQDLWNKDYPEIKLNYLFLGGAPQVIARIQAEQESKQYVCDTQDGSLNNILRQEPPGSFPPYLAPAAADPSAKWVNDVYRGTEPKGLFVAASTSTWAIWTNSQLLPAADRPKSYKDLADNPKYKGQILFRNPWQTGGGNHVFRFATEAYGLDWAHKMAALEPGFAADQDQALVQVARGEYPIGIGLSGRTASQLIKDGLPLAVAWPEDLGIYSSIGFAIARGAPHVNAARVFVNWMLTPPAQKFWADLGLVPESQNVPPTEEWLKGFMTPKERKENLASNEELQVLYDQASAILKK